jgi:hypothetical protein
VLGQVALVGVHISIVRLRASPETLVARVERRETGLGRERMVRRALELHRRGTCQRGLSSKR